MDAHTSLPQARIKAIMRSDPSVHMVSQDAVFAVSKATVCGYFLHSFFIDCRCCCVVDGVEQ